MYIKSLPTDRKILVGGDWNVTLTDQDRQNCTEHRKLLAQQIIHLTLENKLVDIWRYFNPDSKQFTYKGKQTKAPLSRLDRFYISENCKHLDKSANIGPTFADYAAVTLNILPTSTKHRQAYWGIKNALLNDKVLVKCIETIINYYYTIAEEGDELLTLWDEMKVEIRVHIQKYESQIRQDKCSKYYALEQQIRHLTSKSCLGENGKTSSPRCGNNATRKVQRRRQALNITKQMPEPGRGKIFSTVFRTSI
jgi:hypothetical protein